MAQRKSPSSAKPLRGSAKALAVARARAEAVFERLAAALPEPKTELEYTNPFTLLVAVVLSAQATDAGVNKATRALFATADTPAKMAALGEAGLAERIKTIGLYNAKAKNVIALSEALVREHGGEVPHDRDALEALPGVGRKTANVVLNVAFGEAHPRRRHPRLPGLQPHPARARQDAARGRGRAAEGHSRAIHVPCAPLADPARALHLHGARAGVRQVRGEGFVHMGGENGSRPAARAQIIPCYSLLAGNFLPRRRRQDTKTFGAWPFRSSQAGTGRFNERRNAGL